MFNINNRKTGSSIHLRILKKIQQLHMITNIEYNHSISGQYPISSMFTLLKTMYDYNISSCCLAAYTHVWSLESGWQYIHVSGAWSLAGSRYTCLEPGVWLAAYARVWSLESGWQYMHVSGAYSLAGSIYTCLEPGVWLAVYMHVPVMEGSPVYKDRFQLVSKHTMCSLSIPFFVGQQVEQPTSMTFPCMPC